MSKYKNSFLKGLGYIPKDFIYDNMPQLIEEQTILPTNSFQPKGTPLVQETYVPTIHTVPSIVSIPTSNSISTILTLPTSNNVSSTTTNPNPTSAIGNLVSLPYELFEEQIQNNQSTQTTFINTPRPLIGDIKPVNAALPIFENQQVTVTPTTTGVVSGVKPITPVTTTNFTGTVNTTTKSISGKVTDEFGSPLQDVNVYSENDTYLGTATDKDGRFYLQNVPNQDQIVFSAVGYKSVSLPAYSVPSIVQLSTEIEELDEVVLTPTTPTAAKKTNWLLIGGIGLGLLTVVAVITSTGKKQAALTGKFEKVEL